MLLFAESIALRHPDYQQFWRNFLPLFSEHNLWTAFWGIIIVCVVVSAYKKLKSISPVLVLFTLMLVLIIVLTMWTQTRSEPKFLKPVIDIVARFVPQPVSTDTQDASDSPDTRYSYRRTSH